MCVASPLQRVAYAKFATRVVAKANHHWRLRYPDRGDWVMSRDGLHSWLFHWAIEAGRVADPGLGRPEPESAYVAAVFCREPEEVLEQARTYWRHLVAARIGEARELEGAGR